MPRFFIRLVNSSFESVDGGHDYDDLPSAMKIAEASAADIAAADLKAGLTSSIVDVCIENASGVIVARSGVSMARSRLKI